MHCRLELTQDQDRLQLLRIRYTEKCVYGSILRLLFRSSDALPSATACLASAMTFLVRTNACSNAATPLSSAWRQVSLLLLEYLHCNSTCDTASPSNNFQAIVYIKHAARILFQVYSWKHSTSKKCSKTAAAFSDESKSPGIKEKQVAEVYKCNNYNQSINQWCMKVVPVSASPFNGLVEC